MARYPGLAHAAQLALPIPTVSDSVLEDFHSTACSGDCAHSVADPNTPEQDDLSHMTDVELLSLVVGKKAAGRVLAAAGSLADLGKWKISEIVHKGEVKEEDARRLYAALMAGRRAATQPLKRGEVIDSDFAAFRALDAHMGHERNEKFVVMLLDAKNRLMAIRTVSTGTLTATLVHPRDVFAPALTERAHSIIVAHNHPSGIPEPSAEDEALTRRLIQGANAVGIRLEDHVVVGQGDYFSFRTSKPELWQG